MQTHNKREIARGTLEHGFGLVTMRLKPTKHCSHTDFKEKLKNENDD